MTEIVELPEQPWMRGEKYHSYVCAKCGDDTRNTYSEPLKTRMLENRMCFTCDFWVQQTEMIEREHAELTIINGHLYTPGNATSGPFRGMAGRRFDIEYVEPSVHAGKRITTFDLWSGSTMPDDLRSRIADTAVFLNGAEGGGDTGCWNPSDNKTEPYPLPRTIGIRK